MLGPIIPYLIAAALIAASAGWGLLERSGRRSAEVEVAARTAELAANAVALDTITRHAAATTTALERQAAATAGLAARLTPIRRSIDAAAPSAVCADAGPVRAVVDGLRGRGGAAGPGGAPAGAGVPAGVSGRAGAAR